MVLCPPNNFFFIIQETLSPPFACSAPGKISRRRIVIWEDPFTVYESQFISFSYPFKRRRFKLHDHERDKYNRLNSRSLLTIGFRSHVLPIAYFRSYASFFLPRDDTWFVIQRFVLLLDLLQQMSSHVFFWLVCISNTLIKAFPPHAVSRASFKCHSLLGSPLGWLI